MKKLKEEFNKHDSRYVLKKRTDKAAMYYVYGSQTSPDYVTSIEVFIVSPVLDKYGEREEFIRDSKFGILRHSKAFCGELKYWQAEPYYKLLVNHWNDENLDELVEIYEETYLGIGKPGLNNHEPTILQKDPADGQGV